MKKMEMIKTKLASLLIDVKMETLKTDNGVLVFDGELAEGIAVFVEDEEGNRTPAADGEYVTEDNKVITVAEGKIVSIVEKEVEPTTEDVPTEENPEEDVAAEDETTEDAPTEDVPTEETPDNVEELTKRVEELEKIVADLVTAMETLKSETLAKLNMSAAKPIAEEFEQVAKETRKTGISKVDRFIERYGNK